MLQKEHSMAESRMITDIFVEGARRGWNIATSSTIPNVLMAFVIIKILAVTNILAIIGKVFAPVMVVFGLPGEAITVLFAAWLSMGGGVGVVITLFGSGILTGHNIAVLVPAIYLMGSQVQYLGRIVGVIGVNASYIPVMLIISVVNSFIAMFIMNILL